LLFVALVPASSSLVKEIMTSYRINYRIKVGQAAQVLSEMKPEP
jgi:hypothetical protein